jgi:hypothetical protein
MPILHYRVDGGSPFIRTSQNHEEEGAIFPVWSPDSYALRLFENLRIGDKGKIDWRIFFQLKEEDHIVPGGGGAPELHRDEIAEAAAVHAYRARHFEYAQEGDDEEHFRELEDMFQNLMLMIQRTSNRVVRRDQFLSVAQNIQDLLDLGQELPNAYAMCCRERLIRRVPGELHRDLKAFFHITEEEWMKIRDIGEEAEPLSVNISPPEILDSRDEIKKVGTLEQLSELLGFAYKMKDQGLDVEIEIRIKNL